MTAICNCPEEIGWLPEASWPLNEASKAAAQRIYCVGGDPVVPPRGGFKADWPDTRINWTPVAGLGNFDAWAASGDSRSLTGAIITDQSICNPFGYAMQLMAQVFVRWRVSLTGSQTLILNSKIRVDGVDYANTTHEEYGSTTDAIREIRLVYVYKLAEIGAGNCITLGCDTSWTNSDPASALSGMGSYTAVTRIWGGTI